MEGSSFVNDEDLDKGTYYVRVRQSESDYINNLTQSAWSEVVRVVIP